MPTGRAQRVVLISYDGLGADAIASRTTLPTFTALTNEGTTARIVPANPTHTATTHATILTGAPPDRHGIVGNRFHVRGTPREETARGIAMDTDVETLVEAARRQGKRVGCISFPSLDAMTPGRRCDFGIGWTDAAVPSRVVHLTRDDFRREWVPPTWTSRPQRRVSFSPIMRARIEWSVPERTRLDVDVVAYDTSDDGQETYDTFFLEAGEHETPVRAGDWFPISSSTAEGVYGSWSKLLITEPTLARVVLYVGAISRTNAYPADFQRVIDEEIGFWPGEPEGEHRGLFSDQSNRLVEFLTDVQVLALERTTADLLLTYLPNIDEAEHAFHTTQPQIVDAAYAAVDRSLGRVRAALDPARDALVVTGDHGLLPIDTELRLGTLLPAHWSAYASGNAAHLYRFGGPDDSDEVVNMLTSSGYFELVQKRTASMHRHAGDVVAIARPNVMLSASREEPRIVKPTREAYHGALSTHRELHAAFFATGAGVTRAALGEIPQTRIARYVASLLGIAPPVAAE